MADYKAMYYHLSGRMATAIEVLESTADALEATTSALVALKEKLKLAQQSTEDMFINCDEDDCDNDKEAK